MYVQFRFCVYGDNCQKWYNDQSKVCMGKLLGTSLYPNLYIHINNPSRILTLTWVKVPVNLTFCSIDFQRNFFSETFVPNLVSLTHFSLQILGKTAVFSFSWFLVKSLINKNCQNSRTSNDINMNLNLYQ